MKTIFTFLFSSLLCVGFSQTTTNTLTFDGELREYILHVPASYDSNVETALIVSLHGLGDNMANFSGIGFHQLSETENFIVVTPQALNPTETVSVFGQTFNIGDFLQNAWNSGAGGSSFPGIPISLPEPVYPSSAHDDVGFINELIDEIIDGYAINENRIYATGFSMGGFMTNRLGCELSERIAAIASVGGTLGAGVSECLPYRAVPAAHFHSEDDAIVAYEGNGVGYNAEALSQFWITNNNCETTGTSTEFPDTDNNGITVEQTLYVGGNTNSEVEFWKVSGGADHIGTWMQDGEDINTTVKIWEFFERHEKSAIDSAYHGDIGTSIVSRQENIEFKLYPNPVTSTLSIVSEINNTFTSVEIISVIGNVVLAKNYNSNMVDLNVHSLESGTYILRLTNDKGVVGTQMFVKN